MRWPRWASATPREVEQALHELARKELVRPARTSSMEGEAEYGFWHLLVRDVCYAQIPRAARAARHRAAAAWLERKAGERAEDLADVLAYHYLSALELVGAAGRRGAGEGAGGERDPLPGPGRRARARARRRARRGRASPRRSRSPPPATPSAPSLLERWAQAAQQQGRLQETRDALEEALALYREQDESVAAGRVLTALRVRARHAWATRARRRRSRRRWRCSRRSRPAPSSSPPTPSWRAARFVGSAYPEAIAAAERALALAAELGLPEPARALGYPRRGPRLPG